MASATITRVAARLSNGSDATSLRAITMISADRIRSVRMAPRIITFSSGPPTTTTDGSAWCPGPNFSHSFSAPS